MLDLQQCVAADVGNAAIKSVQQKKQIDLSNKRCFLPIAVVFSIHNSMFFSVLSDFLRKL